MRMYVLDILLLCFALVLFLGGILGSFLPIVPGPLLSWMALFTASLSDYMGVSSTVLWISFGVMLGITLLDFVIPIYGTKRFGGSRAGNFGTGVGLIAGLFIPIPFGFLWGTLAGAFIGEYLVNQSAVRTALKAAFGSFLGFLAGSFLKCMYAVLLFLYGIFICFA